MNVALHGQQPAGRLHRWPGRPKKPRFLPRRADQEFLAPELEILEQPPSPVRMALILIISALVVAVLAWTWWGHIDIVAVAQGKIEPVGKVKIIQPQQTGRVDAVLVHNGDHVMAGQALVALDAIEAKAQLQDLVGEAEAAKAEATRRRVGLEVVFKVGVAVANAPAPVVPWSSDIPFDIRNREETVLRQDLSQLGADIASTESQVDEKQVDDRSFTATIAAQQGLVDSLAQLAGMSQELVSKDASSKADWLLAIDNLKAQQVVLATDQSQQADNHAAIAVLRREEAKSISTFLSDYSQKLADADKSSDDLQQKVEQAKEQLRQLTLLSPVDGVVQASAITTVGQIVTTGENLMRIVPAGDSIDIEAYLPNEDIGFVVIGQKAMVKVAAFPFTEYGTVPGIVKAVGHDAVTAADAKQASTDDGEAPVTASLSGTADDTETLVFPISVELSTDSISANGNTAQLSPGMGVTVEIDTGSRRILEYLFSPIVEVTSSAMKER